MREYYKSTKKSCPIRNIIYVWKTTTLSLSAPHDVSLRQLTTECLGCYNYICNFIIHTIFQ